MQNEELRRTQEKLEESRSKYSGLYDFAPVGYFTFDKNGLIIDVNLTGAGQLGIDRNWLIKKPFSQYIEKNSQDNFHIHRNKVFDTPERQTSEIRLKKKDGTEFFAQLESIAVEDETGGKLCRTSVIDITRRRNAEEALKEKQHLHERLLNAIPHPAMLINTKRIVQAANKSAFDIGVKLGGYCWKEFGRCENLSAEDKERLKNNPYDERIQCTFCKADEAMTGTKLKKMNDPEIYAFDKIWDTYWDPIDKDTFLHYAIDVTERREMERKLKAAALTDVLTGLLNRRGFLTLSEQQCKLVKRTRRRLALLYIDLNNMKKINDDFGHEEGDRALIDTARILKNTFRESDIIARIGGDEFSVLITEPAGTGIENIVINNVQDSLKAFNEKSGRPYELSLSMGFAHFDPEHNCSVGDLIHRADALMYEDKKRQLNKEVLSVLPGKKPKKRKEIRFKTGSGIGAEIEVTGNINVKNISQSGICLTNIQQHIAGKYHTLKLTCGDKMIPVKGIVVWTRLTDAQEYDAGMKFIGLTHNDKRSLEAMITGLKEQ